MSDLDTDIFVWYQCKKFPCNYCRRPKLDGDNWWRGHAAAFLKFINFPAHVLRRGRICRVSLFSLIFCSKTKNGFILMLCLHYLWSHNQSKPQQINLVCLFILWSDTINGNGFTVDSYFWRKQSVYRICLICFRINASESFSSVHVIILLWQENCKATYFVVVLHYLRCVVIAVRGTETAEDLITDGLGRACSLTAEDLEGLTKSVYISFFLLKLIIVLLSLDSK